MREEVLRVNRAACAVFFFRLFPLYKPIRICGGVIIAADFNFQWLTCPRVIATNARRRVWLRW